MLCEGGGKLAHGLIASGLADELVFFIAPKVIGTGYPAVCGVGWPLKGAKQYSILESRRVGDDLMLRAAPRNPVKER